MLLLFYKSFSMMFRNMSKKRVSLSEMLKYEAKQFCLNTALHGYRFIVLPKRILLERITEMRKQFKPNNDKLRLHYCLVFWTIIVSISLLAAVTLLCIAWTSFQENPTIVVTDSTHYPIWNYPFPAVTICSFNKMSKSRAITLAQKMTKPYGMTNETLLDELRILFQAIYTNNDQISYKELLRLQDIIDTNDETVEGLLQKLAPSCDELLQRCKWKGGEKRCDSIFEQVRTSEGFCCAFNYYALRNHTFSGSLPRKLPKDPRRVSACGYLTALEILVNSDAENYFVTQISSVGHRVLLHSSYDFPDWTVQNLLTEEKIMNMIGIIPTITYATENIQSVDVNKRKCLFSNETYLHNFVEYSKHNCLTECRMNLTKKLCGCLPFYYYHANSTYPNIKICTLRDVRCLAENKHLIRSTIPGFDFTTIESGHNFGSELSPECNCLPECEYTTYVGEASSGIFTRKYSSNQLNLFGGVEIVHQSVIRVYFNDLVSTKNRRDVVFSWHTLLAYYGGLLGLFIGFSFVSAIEIIYFFTIRLVVDSRDKNNALKEKALKKIKPQNYDTLNPQKLTVKYNRQFLRRRSNSNS